jgi:tetratricopeptide (TPR) repeat protein
LLSLGTIAYYAEDYDRARESYEQSLGIVLELGDRPVQTVCLHNLGEIALIEGDLAGARGYCEQSLKIRREIGDPRPIAETLTTLGTIASELGEGDQARGLYLEAVEIHHELGNKIGLAECLEAVAATCAALGDAPRAATLLGAVDAILESSGAARSWSEDRRAQLDASLRDRLGDSVFEMTFEVGRAMSLDRALDLARGFLGSEEPVESATA